MKQLLALFLLLLSSISHAVTVPATVWYNSEGTSIYNPASTTKYFNNRDAACRYYYDRVYRYQGSYVNHFVNPDGLCAVTYRQYSNGVNALNTVSIYRALQCSPGWTVEPATTTCSNASCPAGMTANSSGQCIDNCLPQKGKSTKIPINCAGTIPDSVCMDNSCTASISSSFVAEIGGCNYGIFTATFTGSSCSGQTPVASLSNPTNANPPPSDKPETDCIKQGQSFGYVNGVAVCVPKTSSGATPVKQTDKTSTTTTNTDAGGNSTTSTSSEVKNATKDGDQVTSQIIKNNPDGTKSEETSTMSIGEFCQKNPNHELCKANKPEEEGAIDCEENPDLPACMQAGTPTDGESIAGETRTVSFAAKQITSGGSCPSDKSIAVAGRTVTFSYSWLCQYAAMFKPFMLAFAYLSAAMFLFWGFRGSQS